MKKINCDLILKEFVSAHLTNTGALASVSNHGTNRGDLFEIALTNENVKRNGLHGVSVGDWVFNGEPVEIKYITKKTKASNQKRGTICKNYLIGFNDGLKIIIKLINKNDLVVIDNKISYQENIGLGQVIDL